jgi:hypothetical protein
MIYSSEPPYEVLHSDAMPAEDLEKIKNFARFWELVVNRGFFPEAVSALLPANKPVFFRFMEISQKLYGKFGRNWSIARDELRAALEELC